MSTDRETHRDRWDDDLAAYVLDALDEREAVAFAEHLESCDTCAERVAWLAPALDVLPASVAQVAPPPALRTRLFEIVEREAEEEATAIAKPVPAKQRRRISMPFFGSFALRPALAGFGVALLLIAGIGGYSLRDGDSTEARTYAALPTEAGSSASGELEVNGDDGSLHIANLPAPERGDVYQAWVQHDGANGRTIPSSVFVSRDDGTAEVAIPHGLEGAARVMITREPAGGSEKPTEGALLKAELD